MTLSAGTRLGPYEVLGPLGAGGMGEVYRARDTRLDRTVAVKVLPSHLAQDPDRLARFEREARAVSALSHPSICALFDVGAENGIHFLVLELIEGETLADRLQKGALPQEQALRIGVQVADALDKAHRAGIVHRDLKPGNVILTKTGAKLLDFGLARITEAAGIMGGALSSLPTRAKPLTEAGSLLGTFQYMAPEQLEGKEADARTDIFALGSVLYEMLTGNRAFEGNSQASLIAAILKDEPKPLSTFQPMTPPALDRVVRTCLAKDPDERWQSAHDVMAELKWIGEGGSQAGVSEPATARPKGKMLLAWGLAATLGALAVGFAWLAYHRPRSSGEVARVQSSILPPAKTAFRFVGFNTGGPPALSPDGRRLAFAATTAEGKTLLFVRPLDSGSAQALAGTDQASYPFWSPDSRFIGFFAQGRLKKVEASGGPVQTLCAGAGGGGSWSRDGTIVFAAGSGPISRISAEGGPAIPVTKLDPAHHQWAHQWPFFLPDGQRFLYLGGTRAGTNTVFVASLDGKENRLLFDVSSNVAYASGRVLYVRDGTLVARLFDPARALPTGEAVVVAEKVQSDPLSWNGVFSVADNGVLVYATGETPANDLTWFDRSGKVLGVVGRRRLRRGVRISPDGKRVAEVVHSSAKFDIWICDLARGGEARFTLDQAGGSAPNWSPDGSRIAFGSSRSGPLDLYVKAASGAGDEELLFHSDNQKILSHWSPDGQYLAFAEKDPKTNWDIWILPLGGDKKPFPFLRTEFVEVFPQFSPDGKWIAYASDATGRSEVYVAPFPGPDGRWQISSEGGSSPRWRRDGKEIFYVSPDQKLMAVDVRTGSSVESGVPVPLFAARFVYTTSYDVSADGQRFLVNAEAAEEQSPLTLVTNWTAGLER